jgi:hypothetical protein
MLSTVYTSFKLSFYLNLLLKLRLCGTHVLVTFGTLSDLYLHIRQKALASHYLHECVVRWRAHEGQLKCSDSVRVAWVSCLGIVFLFFVSHPTKYI